MTAPGPRTRAVRAGIESDAQHGAVVPPIHLSVNYSFERLGVARPYDYTRSGNPTRDLFGDAVARLEGGAGAVVTSSGMSAVGLALSLVEPGELVLAPRDCYGGTWRLLRRLSEKRHLDFVLVDPTDERSLRDGLELRPRLVWIETPSNPLLRITDLSLAGRLVRDVGAILAVDNTFLSPALQRPIDFGADLVVHSATKYLNGHSDVVSGVVVAREPELHSTLAAWANATGVTASPIDSWLALRGLRTLHARIRAHEENARAVARALAAHPAVERVYWPGLADHPGHDVARRQQTGFGGVVSFEIGGSDADAAPRIDRFVSRLRTFSLAESLGGVESLVAHPATMTHASMSPEARTRAGITDRLVRLSVGIEDPADLVADLVTALDAVAATNEVDEQEPAAAGREEVSLPRW